MEFEVKKPVKNPYVHANCISKELFLWMLPIFFRRKRKPLEIHDLYDPLKDDNASKLGDKLETYWKKELVKPTYIRGYKPSLFKALFHTLGLQYLCTWIPIAIVELVLKIAQTVFLKLLVLSFNDPLATLTDKYLYATGVTLTTLLSTLTFHPANYSISMIASRCRIACSSLVYRKILRLSKASQGKTTVGQITNILSTDVDRFDQNMIHIPYIIIGPCQAVIFAVLLWREFGVSTMAGFSFILFLIPVQYWNGALSNKFRNQIAKQTDERSRVMNELIMAIRVIKMYAWEKPFSEMIDKIRRSEVKAIRKKNYLRGFYLAIFVSSTKIVYFFTLMCYVLLGHSPTAEKVFFLVACYNIIIKAMTYSFPIGVCGVGEISACLVRVQKLLLMEEKEVDPEIENSKSECELDVIRLNNLTASWGGKDKPHLTDIQLNLTGNLLVCVVGSVASGKTTFLHALLREMKVISGTCDIKGRIAYASQEPWIFKGNLRENILFGRPFDDSRYEKVTRAAALINDFKQLPYGDMTVVGDRGTSLSGGQKARINLARALYQEADIYLLDDPLSAVDTKVSRHLFEKCIKSHLDGHLRILVTHQLRYLPQADYIIVLQHGQILTQGTYESIAKEGIDFMSFMAESVSKESASRKIRFPEEATEEGGEVGADDQTYEDEIYREGPAEVMAVGSMRCVIYWHYFRSAKANFAFVLLVAITLLAQVAKSVGDYWLKLWTNAEHKYQQGHSEGYKGPTYYMLCFGIIALAVIVGNMLRAMGFFAYTMRISVNIHNWMFSSLFRSPVQFFDDNPSGRVMNRFTKDMSAMDELLPEMFFEFIIIFLQIVGAVAMVIVSNYFLAIPAFILIGILLLLRRYYILTAQPIKRIEGIAKSPIFNHASATFHGLTTIRSANAEKKLIEQFDGYQDIHGSAWFLFFSTVRCFGLWVELFSVLLLAVVAFGFLIIHSASMGGNVGLAVSAALSLTTWFQLGMRQSAETESLMISVERTLEYTNLKPEAPLESTPDKKPPKGWPDKGAIEFQSVYMAYGDKEVLKDLTFDIKPQEKIGVVGRTGAGKSSVIQALFRMTEPRGNIFIDEILVNDIGLHDLRQCIANTPQDPVLFSGTMRYNLDPFGEHKDEELWSALEDVELKNSVPDLDYLVADGGSNFSIGQRQLLCLARAIVRKSRIIVMDEATANVDLRTDTFIQKTVRSKFSNCSIITIAHRLQSVIDCDRILVLDKGSLKEYDHPHNLLQNPNGLLTSMVNNTGRATKLLLTRIAQETFMGKKNSFDVESLAELQSIQESDEDESESEDSEDRSDVDEAS